MVGLKTNWRAPKPRRSDWRQSCHALTLAGFRTETLSLILGCIQGHVGV